MSSPDLTIVIPAYNESERLETGFTRLRAAADEDRLDLARTEIIYVDDGSPDDTAEVAERLVAPLAHHQVLILAENRGKGAAVRAGVRAARGRAIAFTDADLAIDPRQLPALLGALLERPVSVGTRAIGGHVDYGTWLRTKAGRSFNLLVRTLSNIELRDTQCGFKAARTPEAKLLFHYTTIDGFAFDVELLSRARGLGWEVAEVPVSWRDVPGSHVDVARHSLTMLLDLARARLRSTSLPVLLGVDLGVEVARSDVGAVCHGTSLEAAPILLGEDGTRTLVAALHEPADASPALQRLTAALRGGLVRAVSGDEVKAAVRIAGAFVDD